MADPVLAAVADRMDGWFMLSRQRATGERSTGVVVIGSTADEAISLPNEDPAAGVFSRIDHLGNWSVERITPPPTDAE